jgi:hypothetical protein
LVSGEAGEVAVAFLIDLVFFESGWIYRGRDVPLEQEIIRRLKKWM